jgi:hypothetical protein
MKKLIGLLTRTLALALASTWIAPCDAQPVLQWTFDEASSGSQDALDTGAAPAENGIFQGGATRTSNTPGGASTGAADLYLGTAGTDAYLQASDTGSLEGLASITVTSWINLQADPVGNDRIAALQATNMPPDPDFDDNNVVDGKDFLTWQQWFGIDDASADNTLGDANSDANVLGDDLKIWERQFGGQPFPQGSFAGFTLNINAPNEGTYSANDFRLGMFIGGLDAQGLPLFEFGQSTADIEGLGGQWVFVATTFNGATGDLLFFTGTESASPSQLGTGFVLNAFKIEGSGANFYIGKTDAAPAANTSLEGFIDDVRIYNSALTAAELDAVRLENLPASLAVAVPEPGSWLLASLLLLGTPRRR